MLATVSNERSNPTTLTTRATGQLCGVSFRTVIRWIERGELPGYRLPGRGDYRISAVELKAFMLKHGMVAPGVDDSVRRVLIMDDDHSVAAAIERTLRRAGFKCMATGNGFEAGTLLHSFKPHLMTLDLRMPGLDGFGVLRFLREHPPSHPTKILVLSGDIDERLREAVQLGAHEALAKPFDSEHFLLTVQRLLTARMSGDGGAR